MPLLSKLTSTVHLFPVLGTYITLFGSTEGTGSVEQARQLNDIICQQSDDDTRQLPFLHAAIRAWWIAEYSGWYMEGAAGDGLPGVDLDAGKPLAFFIPTLIYATNSHFRGSATVKTVLRSP